MVLENRIKMRHIYAVGIGTLLILLALAGTGSADPSQGTDCSGCHSFDGSIFFKVHKFDGISAPTATDSCAKCHVSPPDDMSLTSTGSFYSSTHRYNATTLASEILAAPGCGICHVDAVGNNFNLLTGTPTYLTSKTCQACHKAKYDKWSDTLHRVMLTPKDKAQAMGLPTPWVGWANISYVIVTKFEFAYINTTGYFLAQNDAYETETEEWVNSSHKGGRYGTCGNCHTTGWNTTGFNGSNGILPGFNATSFSEPGIACERCHKPAGNGHQVVVNYSGNQCRECHTGGNHGTGWENGEHAPPPYENGTNCMFCHSSFDQYKNQGATIANATGVSCGVCHNIHDMTDSKYAATFSNGVFNPTTWSEVADSKLAFFNATASIAAGTDIFDDLSNRLLYPGTDASRKDSSYGTAPINLTGRPVSDVLCSMCHFRHGLAHIANVSLSHGSYYYGKEAGASCIDCHMQGANATVGKDQMKLHANDPLADVNKSCGSTTGCHTSSVQNLSASSHSVVPVQREWKASAHNDKEVTVSAAGGANHFFGTINTTTGIANSQLNSCLKCKDPINWNPSIADSNTTYKVNLTDSFKGITCTVCHNLHDMGDWLAETKAAFGVQKPYAWYNRDAILTGTRYKANYTMMANTIELCGNCHSNIRYGNTGPGWAIGATNPTSVHGYPAKDIFVDSVKQKMLNPATNATFECIDCHMATKITDSSGSILPDSQKVKGHSFKVNTSILMGTNCSNCHITGSLLGNLSTTIENIQAETNDNWNATNITVQSALATIKAYSGEKSQSRDLIAKAYWNLRLVYSDESWGVHNPNGTKKLLDDAKTLANESLAKLGEGAPSNSLSNSGGGSWQYYRDITLNNTGSALTDYQVLVNLTGGNFPLNANTSGADIRFANLTGSEMKYWIERWDQTNSSSLIWVKVSNIPSGISTIKMFYGNPLATSSSNGTATFEFFDDFEGSYNASWTPGGTAGTNQTVSTDRKYTGIYSLKSPSGSPTGGKYLTKSDKNYGTNISVDVEFYDPNSDTNTTSMFFADDGITLGGEGVGSAAGITTFYAKRLGNTWSNTSIARSTGWHKFSFHTTPSGIEIFIDNTSVGTNTSVVNINRLFLGSPWAGTSVTNYYYDTVKIRKHVTTGLANTVGAETSTSIKYYLPFLYQRADFIYDAGVHVQNDGTTSANVTIQFYYLNGTSAGSGTYIVLPGELMTKHAFDITGTMPVYVGPAVVTSNVSVQVQGYIKTVNEGVYSIAPSLTVPATSSSIPFLYQRADNIYDAGVQVFNPGTSNAIVTIRMYYINGTLAGIYNESVSPKAELSKYVFDIVTGQSIFVGPAQVSSDQPVVAQGFIRTKASNIYSIAPSVSTSVLNAYLPFLYQRADNIYDAGVQVFNPGNGTALVTIRMYYLNGTLAGTYNSSIGPKAELSKYAFDIVTGDSIFVGPAEVTSDQPIVAQGFIRTKASNVYSIAPQVRKPVAAGKAHVPFLYQTVSATHDAGIQAMNPNGVAANVSIKLFYPNGTEAGNVSANVGPYAEISKYAFDIAPNGTDFSGSAIVTADQPIVSQGFIRKKSTNIYSIAPPVER